MSWSELRDARGIAQLGGDAVRDTEALYEIEPGSSDVPRFFVDILDVIEESAAVLNFNDALLVVLQRNAIIDDVASFDEGFDKGFDKVEGFRRLA